MFDFIYYSSGRSLEACDWEQYLKYDFKYEDLVDYMNLRRSKSPKVMNLEKENTPMTDDVRDMLQDALDK